MATLWGSSTCKFYLIKWLLIWSCPLWSLLICCFNYKSMEKKIFTGKIRKLIVKKSLKALKLNFRADTLSSINHSVKISPCCCFKDGACWINVSSSRSPHCCGRRNVKPQCYFCSGTLRFDLYLTAFWSPPLTPASLFVRVQSRNVWPLATSGSTEMWPLMKSHPIAVSPDHRGVFGALTGPMRASIWPWPHEFEWAEPS